MTTKHTPGEWIADFPSTDYGDSCVYVETQLGFPMICRTTRPPCEQVRADFNLIAAAPALLEACKKGQAYEKASLEVGGDAEELNKLYEDWANAMHAAVASATEGTPE